MIHSFGKWDYSFRPYKGVRSREIPALCNVWERGGIFPPAEVGFYDLGMQSFIFRGWDTPKDLLDTINQTYKAVKSNEY